MNPFRHISESWFCGTLLAILLALVACQFATDPGPRPTEHVGTTEEEPPAIDPAALTLERANRLSGSEVRVEPQPVLARDRGDQRDACQAPVSGAAGGGAELKARRR